MYTELSTTKYRAAALVLAVSLLCGEVSPILLYADTATSTPTTTETATSTDSGAGSGGSLIDQRLQDRLADTTGPTIEPHSTVVAQATSTAGVFVVYTPPATSDDVDPVGVASCTPAPGSVFAVGTTTVTCTAVDAAGNAANPTTFKVAVSAPLSAEASTTATSTPPAGTGGGGSGTTTASTTPPSGGGSTTTTISPEATSSVSSTQSAEVPADESDTDNTNFDDIIDGPGIPGPDDPRPVVDATATSTENLALEPELAVASSTDGTGSKVGGSIYTGNAVASTSVKNTLNITRSNIDGPGASNSSHIKSDTSNDATLTTQSSAGASSGDNRGLGGEGLATIDTGDAYSNAEVLNVVNTNFFNSKGWVLFLNPRDGGLDLRNVDLSYFSGGVGASPTQFGCTILTCLNSSALSILNKNTATVRNTVAVRASTGSNAATSTKEGGVDIRTGNAYASADVLNMVNTNFINSSYLVTSFNNFGNLNDDVVLPGAGFFDQLLSNGNSLPEMNSSSYVVNNDNTEKFVGSTTARAITGSNSATTTGLGHGEITTGAAYSSSNAYTAANQTRVGGASVLFVFRVTGSWSGTIKGLPDGLSWRRTAYGVEIYSNGSGTLPGSAQGLYNSSTFIASSTNEADITTDVDVLALTGENSAATEHATGTIMTGDAYASANVVNLVNTNIVGRKWIFGTFNIFGDWSGDIDFGGHSPNLAVSTVVSPTSQTAPGADITYQFLVTNKGATDATNVVLSAAYDKNLLLYTRGNAPSTDVSTGTRWSLGTLAPGASRTIDATMHVLAAGLPAGISISVPLVATLSGTERDQDDTNNSAQTFITVTAPAAPSSPTPSVDTRGRGGGGGRSFVGTSGSGGTSSSGGTSTTPPPSSTPATTPPPTTGNTTPAPATGTGGVTVSEAVITGGSGTGTGTGSLAKTTKPEKKLGSGSPKITVEKTVSIGTSTAPVSVDYKVVVKNSKKAGPAYEGKLTDTLTNPGGGTVFQRQWDLGVIVPGDMITLTYSATFAATSSPGAYTNTATVYGKFDTGKEINQVSGVGIITITPQGVVLGTTTQAVCGPTLGGFVVRGGANDPLYVAQLQLFLNTYRGETLPVSAVYDIPTQAAVNRFQAAYAPEILYPLGLSGPTGSVYSMTQRKINSIACGGVEPTPVTIATPVTAPVATYRPTPVTAPVATYRPAPAAPKPLVVKETPAPQASSGWVSWIGNIFGW